MDSPYIIEIKGVQKAFGKFIALKDINLNIPKGKIIGFLGKNGAGKTTLIKTILGLIKQYEGQILYGGQPIDTNDPFVMGTIGSLVDTSFHEDLSAYDNLRLLMMASVDPSSNHHEKINELLKLVGLEHNAKDKVKSFSMGMKQRLALAQAFLSDAKLLILDEPFVGLDPLGIEIIKERLRYLCKEKKVSIIFSSHQLAEVAELSEELIVINNGEIKYSGSYGRLKEGGKKYHLHLSKELPHTIEFDSKVVISGGKKELMINHADYLLNECIKQLYLHDLAIESIDIEESALLDLFKE